MEWDIADLPAVECDPVLVKQIFQNLLANALKFTRTRVHTRSSKWAAYTENEDRQREQGNRSSWCGTTASASA